MTTQIDNQKGMINEANTKMDKAHTKMTKVNTILKK